MYRDVELIQSLHKAYRVFRVKRFRILSALEFDRLLLIFGLINLTRIITKTALVCNLTMKT